MNQYNYQQIQNEQYAQIPMPGLKSFFFPGQLRFKPLTAQKPIDDLQITFKRFLRHDQIYSDPCLGQPKQRLDKFKNDRKFFSHHIAVKPWQNGFRKTH
jgi:hypothetical protein